MLFSCLALFFGTLIAHRTLQKPVEQRFISSSTAEKLVSCILLAQFIVLWMCVGSIFALVISAIFPLIIIETAYRCMISRREKKFVDNFCHFIDLVLLEMHVGRSFRSSLELIAHQQEAFIQQKILTLLEALDFSVKRALQDGFLQLLLEEFRQIDRQPHNGIRRLQSLRHRFRLQSEFRRKSEQASLQARSQSLILAFLYIGSAIFMWRNYALAQHLTLLLLSATLFAGGTFWISFFSGRFKWKT
jgi:Flp pilus assembly protein TadB